MIRANTKYSIPSSNGHRKLHFSVAFYILFLISSLQAVAVLASASDRSTGWSRGVSEGVSEKSVSAFLDGKAAAASSSSFPWTNHMLAWQRTAYHFQPQKNWMNGM
ncbi:hypothetical protein ACLOJK_005485 [Asimina triloba]